ncbi:MAG: HAMP domain-containing sensor histidine kinase [Bdellovibrionota bacterium]
MRKKSLEKNLLFKLLFIQFGFISFILGLFLFSTAINKKEMAEQITYQVQSQIKSAPSREIPEALAAAQSKNFNATGYFDEYGNRVFTLPASLNPSYFSNRNWKDKILEGLIEVDIYFDDQQENKAGTLKFVYPRFSFIPQAIIFWLLSILISIFLFKHYRKVWLASMEKERIEEQNSMISRIVDQVSHDLKSPIQTLFAVVDDTDDLCTEDKSSIYSAIDRIKGITADLAGFLHSNAKVAESYKFDVTKKEEPSILHFASTIKQLCEEKKIAYKDKNIVFNLKISSEALSRASLINESDFLRVCSNLIRNSCESLESKFQNQPGGKITIAMDVIDEQLVIQILDNGVGISEQHFDKLEDKGFSYGKPEGTGLGLHYVYQKVQSWCGQIKVSSELNQWTKFEMSLPLDPHANFFENTIDLNGVEEILILDDDPSVFQRWKRRLSNFQGSISFFDKLPLFPQKLVSQNNRKYLAFIDHEIRGSSMTGLNFIIEKKFLKDSILVTNQYWNPNLLSEVKKLGIKIIPKPIIEEIEIL